MKNKQTRKAREPFTQKLMRFMYGRNGYDRICRAAMVLCIVLAVVNIFVNSWIIMTIETAVMAYAIFRVLSRNVYRRRAEDAKYAKFEKALTRPFKLMRNKWRDRKTHVYRKCPSCKNVLRLPKRKGKHTVNCPCCHNRFDIKV